MVAPHTLKRLSDLQAANPQCSTEGGLTASPLALQQATMMTLRLTCRLCRKHNFNHEAQHNQLTHATNRLAKEQGPGITCCASQPIN